MRYFGDDGPGIFRMIRPDVTPPTNAYVLSFLKAGTTDKYEPMCVVFNPDQVPGALSEVLKTRKLDDFEIDSEGNPVSTLFHVPVSQAESIIKLD